VCVCVEIFDKICRCPDCGFRVFALLLYLPSCFFGFALNARVYNTYICMCVSICLCIRVCVRVFECV